MQVDDREFHPMTFVLELDFAGTLQKKHFENAVSQALQRHMLFSVREIEIGRHDLPSWIPDPTFAAHDFLR